MNHIDKKLKEAADSHFPSYDDGAWKKMETLLDTHLPQQKEKKRRIILFLFLFLLLAGSGAYLLISRPWDTNKVATVPGEESHPNKSLLKAVQNKSDQHSENRTTETGSDKNNLADDKVTTTTPVDNSVVLQLNHKQYIDAVQETINNRLNKMKKNPETIEKNSTVNQPEEILSQTDQQKNMSNELTTAEQTDKNEVEQKDDKTVQEENIKNDPLLDSKAKKTKKNNKLFLSISAGPDVSAAGTKDIGQIRFSYGAMAGFTYHEKFTLRAGIFSARKIYSAQPDSYNPPPVFWTYYPNLKTVNADCAVTEIPVLFTYHFSDIKNHSFSATAGISSYLMKRETYDYYYINSSGQPANRKYTINDVNKHYFSVLTISGGYHRKFNNTFSLSVEPYLKVPLNGVGYGKVHLNSAGVLVSTNINFLPARK